MSTADILITVKGQIRNPGTYSISSGENILDVIFGRAGGMAHPRFLFKAALVGGPLGYFADKAALAAPLLSSEEIMVFDQGSCIVNVVRLLNEFIQTTPALQQGCSACQAALRSSTGILAKLSTTKASNQDVAALINLATTQTPDCPSRCAILNPLTSALRLFAGEFAEHGAGSCRASICSDLMLSPCVNACPSDVDLPGTLALAQLGRYKDAVALGRHDNPLFLTCGHVCEEPPCQKNCKRLSFDDPIFSQSLHRYIGEKAAQCSGDLPQALRHEAIAAGADSGKRVAVVGAGPAGLAAAYFLTRLGHQTVIFDKNPLAGGMATFGIPAYRLPRNIIFTEVAAIQALGVEIRPNISLGRDVTLQQLQEEYAAIILALGNGKSRRLGITGEDLPSVIPAIEFLHQVSLTGTFAVGPRVLVVGGGNVAVDAARTARRLGAEQVTMMCVEDRFEMPASAGEITAAEAEGVALQVMMVPLSFTASGEITTVTYTAITPGPYDSIGRRWPPIPITDAATTADFETIIIAIGQVTDLTCLADSGIAHGKTFFDCDDSQASNLPGVFVAGDCAGSLNSVVKAVGSGKAAAYAVDKYLTGSTHQLIFPLRSKLGCQDGEYTCSVARRVPMPEQPAAARIHNFAPVELGLDDAQAAYEMLRCICAAKGGRQ